MIDYQDVARHVTPVIEQVESGSLLRLSSETPVNQEMMEKFSSVLKGNLIKAGFGKAEVHFEQESFKLVISLGQDENTTPNIVILLRGNLDLSIHNRNGRVILNITKLTGDGDVITNYSFYKDETGKPTCEIFTTIAKKNFPIYIPPPETET